MAEKVIGYEIQITDNRQPTTAEVIQHATENSHQTKISTIFRLISKKENTNGLIREVL